MVAQGQRDLLLEISQAFTRFRIHFLLTGSFAVSYYGYPRATHDIDFIVTIDTRSLSQLTNALSALGKEYVWDKREIVHMVQDNLFTVYHSETATKIDLWIISEKDFEKKYQKKRSVLFDRRRVSLVSPEDLILTKLSWCKKVFSERHMRDCAGMWHIQKSKLDKEYIKKQAESLGIMGLLEQIQHLPY